MRASYPNRLDYVGSLSIPAQKRNRSKKQLANQGGIHSRTGTRTRVCWVRASYHNRLDYMGRLNAKCASHATTLLLSPNSHKSRFPRSALISLQPALSSFQDPAISHIRRHQALHRTRNSNKRYQTQLKRRDGARLILTSCASLRTSGRRDTA